MTSYNPNQTRRDFLKFSRDAGIKALYFTKLVGPMMTLAACLGDKEVSVGKKEDIATRVTKEKTQGEVTTGQIGAKYHSSAEEAARKSFDYLKASKYEFALPLEYDKDIVKSLYDNGVDKSMTNGVEISKMKGVESVKLRERNTGLSGEYLEKYKNELVRGGVSDVVDAYLQVSLDREILTPKGTYTNRHEFSIILVKTKDGWTMSYAPDAVEGYIKLDMTVNRDRQRMEDTIKNEVGSQIIG